MSRTPLCLAFALTLTACSDDAPTSPGMAPAGATAAATYNVIPLGALGGTGGEASDMEGGRIVGHAETGEGEFHAFLWENGVMRDLGALPQPQPELYGASRAAAINDLGAVVGVSSTGGPDHAVLWQAASITDLGALPGSQPSSYADGINDSGQIVGGSFYGASSDLGTHAVLWNPPATP